MNRRAIRTTLFATLALALALVPAALAGKGGQRGAAGSASATLVPDCNPCSVGTTVHFTGSGYDGSQLAAQLYVSGSWAPIPVSANGTVSFSWTLPQATTYDFRVYQKGKGKNKLVMKSQLYLTAR